jgi:hypothetical protein
MLRETTQNPPMFTPFRGSSARATMTCMWVHAPPHIRQRRASAGHQRIGVRPVDCARSPLSGGKSVANSVAN